MPILIRGLRGLGDNVYQRPFVRASAAREPTWLDTPWPQLYHDLVADPSLQLHLCYSGTPLRTQAKNAARQSDSIWSKEPQPRRCRSVQLIYLPRDFGAGRTICQTLDQLVPLQAQPFAFRLPIPDEWRHLAKPYLCHLPKPFALVRPPTVRREWRNEARNPDPAAFDAAVEVLRKRYAIATVADLESGAEWLDGPPIREPIAAWCQGEVPLEVLCVLMQEAAVVLGGVGFIVPLGVAIGARVFVIYGGNGGCNAPELILDRRMDTSRFGYAIPDSFCRCQQHLHKCDKRIDAVRLRDELETWISSSENFATAA